MAKTLKSVFLTTTLAYLLAALLLLVLLTIQSGGRLITSYLLKDLAMGLTLALSEFPWWGDFYFLAIPVPWLTSFLLLILLTHFFGGGARRRLLWGGLSVFAYYFTMHMVFIVQGLIGGWGDVGYELLWIWPVAGFGLGCLAALISGITLKTQVINQPVSH